MIIHGFNLCKKGFYRFIINCFFCWCWNSLWKFVEMMIVQKRFSWWFVSCINLILIKFFRFRSFFDWAQRELYLSNIFRRSFFNQVFRFFFCLQFFWDFRVFWKVFKCIEKKIFSLEKNFETQVSVLKPFKCFFFTFFNQRLYFWEFYSIFYNERKTFLNFQSFMKLIVLKRVKYGFRFQMFSLKRFYVDIII